MKVRVWSSISMPRESH